MYLSIMVEVSSLVLYTIIRSAIGFLERTIRFYFLARYTEDMEIIVLK